AMKLGAYDYLTKPFKTEELVTVIHKASEKKSIVMENLRLKAQVRRHLEFERIITGSPLMVDLLETVKKIAPSDIPVIICGESGVGKELVAMAIHAASHRADRPFVPINCGAIPEDTLASELFGHEKGAFTGAYTQKMGLIEVAHSGTLFLDEIGEMSHQLQAKLLRVLETGKFFRVGGIREIEVDVRFVSATNRDITAAVQKGTFREDLYFRISAMSIVVPPLRERKEDIPLIVEHVIGKNPHLRHRRFSKEAIRALCNYSWPGNVRELQNVIQRVLLLSTHDTVEPDDLPADLVLGRKVHGKRLEDIEKEHILRVLKESGGHRGKAADMLGIDPKTLYRKLLAYGIAE
ncbi:MAG TPA: sigma-54 dependent transcriptional regulator, partial [Dissulfurispiraceae bacterium]|nr:sigma-54 dependent transcriptional regulator [Dissulfurispiraceae bacterium]